MTANPHLPAATGSVPAVPADPDLVVVGPLESVGDDGRPLHAEDAVAQLVLAVRNLERRLSDAGLEPRDLVALDIVATSSGVLAEVDGVLGEHLAELDVRPQIFVSQVDRLSCPAALVAVAAIARRHSG